MNQFVTEVTRGAGSAFTENGAACFERLPILFWHGALDSTVPIEMSRPFYEQQIADGKLDNVKYIAADRAGHAVTRAGVLEVCEYLAVHLA